jgi:nucleotide sugar dehydrogenase
MYKIGIIGNGFVGSAIAAGLGLHADVCVYDTDSKKSINTFEEIMECEFIFIAVPTPMNLSDNNKIDLSIVRDVFNRISEYPKHSNNICIIKSTVVPGTTRMLASEYPNLQIVFNPEFLTERSARLDFINTSRIVIGGKVTACERLAALYRVRFPHTPIVISDSVSAEFIKYMCNCFFSTKVSFMNEMKQTATALDLDWDGIMKGFLLDGRIGNSHVEVPGHDGHLGFGGKCFPKDLNAFINFFKESGVSPTVMTAAWEKNIEVRNVADWEKIKGATSNKEE